MSPWVPLFQTALWVVLIGTVVWRYHAQLVALIGAIQKRVEKGSSIKAGPFELGEDARPESVSNQKAHLAAESKRSRPLNGATGWMTLKRRYLLAEDLVIRKLQSEFGIPIKRQISLGNDVRFDGLFTKSGLGFGIEVKYISRRDATGEITEGIQQAAKYTANIGLGRFMLIIVFVFDTDEILTSEMTKAALDEASRYADRVIVRLYSFHELESEFGLSVDEV